MTKNLNQFKIGNNKFQAYPDKTLVGWLDDGRQYVVQPFGKGYLATFRNGYSSEVLERITFHKLQYCALAYCASHFEAGKPDQFQRTGIQSWARK